MLEADMEMNGMENSDNNMERRIMPDEELLEGKESLEIGFLAFEGLRSRHHHHILQAKSGSEGSGSEGSGAEDTDMEGSGMDGSGAEYDGSGGEGSGTEGSGGEGLEHMEPGEQLVLPLEPELQITQVISSHPPDLVYVEPVSYDGASYPFLPPEEVVLPDTAGETAPHIVYPAPLDAADSAGLGASSELYSPIASAESFAPASSADPVFSSDLPGIDINSEIPASFISSELPSPSISLAEPAIATGPDSSSLNQPSAYISSGLPSYGADLYQSAPYISSEPSYHSSNLDQSASFSSSELSYPTFSLDQSAASINSELPAPVIGDFPTTIIISQVQEPATNSEFFSSATSSEYDVISGQPSLSII
jgi:hypothetical protein